MPNENLFADLNERIIQKQYITSLSSAILTFLFVVSWADHEDTPVNIHCPPVWFLTE